MTGKFKYTVIAAAIAQSLAVGAVQAQTAPTETKEETKAEAIETIMVRGFGATLSKSLQQKKYSESTVEIISTDDLGQLPDVTIADALGRLPGVAAERDRGNASSLSIRGLGPRLNIATMNGREIVSAEPSRDVRYEQFPAELINSVEVYKSPMANNVEGGIAGLVNMNFISPLSRDKRLISISGNVMEYSLADDIPGADGSGKKGSFAYADKLTDNFGIVFGLAYQDQPSIQRESAFYSYNNNAAEQGDINEDGITEAAPWGGKTGTKYGNIERTGALTILEWAPTNRLNLTYDLFYSKFDIEEHEDQLWFDGWGNWGGSNNWSYQNSSTAPEIVTRPDGTQQLVGGGMLTWNDALNGTLNNAAWFQENQLVSTGLKASWQGDIWSITADAGYSEASIESRWVNIKSDYLGTAPLDIRWSNTGKQLQVWAPDDISNTANYAVSSMTVDKDRDLTDKMVSLKLDFERGVEWGVFESLMVGGRYADRDKNNDVISWSQAPLANSNLTNYAYNYPIGGDFVAPTLIGFTNWGTVAQQGFGGINNRSQYEKQGSDLAASWQVEETNTALYSMLRMVGEIGSVPYTGNVGIRYVHTSSTSSGHQYISSTGEYSPEVVDHSYSEILPSLNMVFSISDEAQIRLGLSRAMSRPPLIEMRSGFTLNTSNDSENTGSGGNATLNPFVADQLDLGLEYYWNDTTAASASVFFKDMKNHIAVTTEMVTIEGVEYRFSRPVNGNGGQIRGIELMYQQAFTMLPGWLDGLGVYANYSFTDSNITEMTPVNNPFPLGGLSRHVGSFTFWYYRAGLDAKVSANYRSAGTSVGSWDDVEMTRTRAETTVDASISYEFTENFKVMLQAQNLTNEKSFSYFDNDPSRPANYREWGRRYLLGFQYAM